ncbi:MAG TPA: hypothetical protein VGF77_17530 [Allosphingosinicella sp.]
MGLFLLLSVQAAPAPPPPPVKVDAIDFDLARFKPADPAGNCGPSQGSEIVVCGRRKAYAYPLAEMAKIYEPKPLRAEKDRRRRDCRRAFGAGGDRSGRQEHPDHDRDQAAVLRAWPGSAPPVHGMKRGTALQYSGFSLSADAVLRPGPGTKARAAMGAEFDMRRLRPAPAKRAASQEIRPGLSDLRSCRPEVARRRTNPGQRPAQASALQPGSRRSSGQRLRSRLARGRQGQAFEPAAQLQTDLQKAEAQEGLTIANAILRGAIVRRRDRPPNSDPEIPPPMVNRKMASRPIL